MFAGFSLLLIPGLVGVITLFYGVVTKRGAPQAGASALIIFFGLFGGGMIPVENMPKFMKPLTVLSPVFWGQDGIKKILIDHSLAGGLVVHATVLCAIALVFNGAAMLCYNRRMSA